MSLTHAGSITKTGFTTCGTIYNESQIVLCDYSQGLRRYSFDTQAVVGSTVTLGNNALGVAIVEGSCALTVYSGMANVELTDIGTGYKQSYTNSNSVSSSIPIGQIIAYDPTTKIAMWTVSSVGKLAKFDFNTFTITSTTITYLDSSNTNQTIQSVVYYKPGRFLIAGENGLVAEIDTDFNIIKSKWMTYQHSNSPKLPSTLTSNSGSGVNIHILGLAIVNDLVTVVSRHTIYQIQWETGDILYVARGINSLQNFPTMAFVSPSASGSVFIGDSSGSVAIIHEFDVSVSPLKHKDSYYPSVSGIITAFGFNASGQGYVTNNGTNISFVNIDTKAVTTKNLTFQDPSGIPVEGEVIIYSVTDNKHHTSNVVATSGTSLLLPTGKTWKQIGIIYSGTDQKFEVSEFTT